MKPEANKNTRIKFDKSKCIECYACETVCFQQAISVKDSEINTNCIECFHCAAVCPTGCIMYDNMPGDILPVAKLDARDLRLLLLNRRSHRIFEDKNISNDVLQNMIEVMRYSPSSKNAQQVYVTIVTSAAKIQRLNDDGLKTMNKTLKKSFNALTWPFFMLIYGKKKTKSFYRFKNRFFERQKFVPNLITYKAPCIFIFHSPKSLITNGEMDCNIWASYTTIYAESLGLRTCFLGYVVSILKRNKISRVELGIPDNHIVQSAFAIGYPKMTFKRKPSREEPKVTILS